MLVVAGVLALYHILLWIWSRRIENFSLKIGSLKKDLRSVTELINKHKWEVGFVALLVIKTILFELWFLMQMLGDERFVLLVVLHLSFCLLWVVRLVIDKEVVEYVKSKFLLTASVVLYSSYMVQIGM